MTNTALPVSPAPPECCPACGAKIYNDDDVNGLRVVQYGCGRKQTAHPAKDYWVVYKTCPQGENVAIQQAVQIKGLQAMREADHERIASLTARADKLATRLGETCLECDELTAERDALKTHAYVWAGANPFTGEQVLQFLNDNDALTARLDAALTELKFFHCQVCTCGHDKTIHHYFGDHFTCDDCANLDEEKQCGWFEPDVPKSDNTLGELRARLEAVTGERDAAVADVAKITAFKYGQDAWSSGQANRIRLLESELTTLRAQVAQLKADYNSEVDEFNAGFDAGQAGVPLLQAQDKWDETHGNEHDVFAPGYAWGAFDRLRAQVAEMRDAIVLLKAELNEGDYAIVRKDRKPVDIVEAIRVGNILEKIDKALAPGGGVGE